MNYKDQCPICNTKVIGESCSLDSCYKEYQYDVRVDDNYADFYIGNYIIEYNLNEDGSYKDTNIVTRKNVRLVMKLNIPFDFSLGVDKIAEKIENLQAFK